MSFLRYMLLGYALVTFFVAGGLFFNRAGKSYTMLAIFGAVAKNATTGLGAPS